MAQDKLRNGAGRVESTLALAASIGDSRLRGRLLDTAENRLEQLERTDDARALLNEMRKEHKPKNCVLDAAAAMGVAVLTEEEYFALQQLGEFDTKSSSWLQTPPEIRELGGAVYGDRRYNRVFIGHNGAESYYSGRGFRGMLKV